MAVSELGYSIETRCCAQCKELIFLKKKDKEFLHELSPYLSNKKDSAQWNW
jgi:hypothetical protein